MPGNDIMKLAVQVLQRVPYGESWGRMGVTVGAEVWALSQIGPVFLGIVA